MHERVKQLERITPGINRGKTQLDGFGCSHNWTKRSIFWELEYWPSNLIRHNLDVMHIEKNVFDNVFFTVLDDPTKTKDNCNARRDLQLFTYRESLFLKSGGRRDPEKPKATYTVTREQKRLIFDWVHSLQFPDGYGSNISKCFSTETLHVFSMKSHDAHVFMQRLMPVAFCDFLPDVVWEPLVELSLFFRQLCTPRIMASEMARLEASIVQTICKLERIFPPAFFDSMEHLPIHLPYEARVGGPVQYRWMYPFERRMHTLKDLAKNPSRPEASICEAYLDVEVSNFCSMYFSDDMETHMTRLSRNEVGITPAQYRGIEIFRNLGRPIGKGKRGTLSNEDYNLAHLYILLNCDEVLPYFEQFDEEMCYGLDDDEKRLTRQNEFIPWFRQTISSTGFCEETEYLEYLANGPHSITTVYNGYMVNGYRFRAHGHTRVSGTSNSGVSARMNNDDDDDSSKFYGILQQVIELTFGMNSVVLFRCSWFDVTSPAGIWTDKRNGLVELNPNRPYPGYDPFILAAQASQVYYATSPGNRRRTVRGRRGWLSVFSTRARSVIIGFTSGEREVSSDTEGHDNSEQVYQDMAPPVLGVPFLSDADTSRINLATGLNEPINEPMNVMPGEPSEEDLVDLDDEIEDHSGDDYEDNFQV